MVGSRKWGWAHPVCDELEQLAARAELHDEVDVPGELGGGGCGLGQKEKKGWAPRLIPPAEKSNPLAPRAGGRGRLRSTSAGCCAEAAHCELRGLSRGGRAPGVFEGDLRGGASQAPENASAGSGGAGRPCREGGLRSQQTLLVFAREGAKQPNRQGV